MAGTAAAAHQPTELRQIIGNGLTAPECQRIRPDQVAQYMSPAATGVFQQTRYAERECRWSSLQRIQMRNESGRQSFSFTTVRIISENAIRQMNPLCKGCDFPNLFRVQNIHSSLGKLTQHIGKISEITKAVYPVTYAFGTSPSSL